MSATYGSFRKSTSINPVSNAETVGRCEGGDGASGSESDSERSTAHLRKRGESRVQGINKFCDVVTLISIETVKLASSQHCWEPASFTVSIEIIVTLAYFCSSPESAMTYWSGRMPVTSLSRLNDSASGLDDQRLNSVHAIVYIKVGQSKIYGPQ